jgi:hypothetical protein
MSIFDSISENENEVIGVAISAEIGLRAHYERLSNAFWSKPSYSMVLTLDKLLEVIEEITAWRKDSEAFMDNLDKEG